MLFRRYKPGYLATKPLTFRGEPSGQSNFYYPLKYFHVVVLLRRLKNVPKSVMHVKSFCFTNIKLLLFCRSRSRRRCRWLCFLIEFFGRND